LPTCHPPPQPNIKAATAPHTQTTTPWQVTWPTLSLPSAASVEEEDAPLSFLLRYAMQVDSMAENVIARRSSRHPTTALTAMSDLPVTISPPSLLMATSTSSSATTTTRTNTTLVFGSPLQALISPPAPLSSRSSSTTPSVISRPPKRHVRPRATTEVEKQVRLEERKLANRTAAKISRERQRHAMDEALRENERLKLENADLLSRLANLEQRMQAMEHANKHQQQQYVDTPESNADVTPMLVDEGTPTTQSARLTTLPTEQQCPIPSSPTPATPRISKLNSATSSITTSLPSMPLLAATTVSTCQTTTPYRLTSLQTRTIIYLLQMLTHSFALSLHFQIPLTKFLSTQQTSSNNSLLRLLLPQHPLLNSTLPPHTSPWMTRRQPGYATPSPASNGVDSSGATMATVGKPLRKTGAKNMLMASTMLRRQGRETGVIYYKDWLRRVKRSTGSTRGHVSSIRLIIKKKSGKRMNK
jgi:regulator of replication initiation timing